MINRYGRIVLNILATCLCWMYLGYHFLSMNSKSFHGQYSLAYLDPSTGAMIISAIVGVFATIALGAKTIWYKIMSPFRKKQPTSTAEAPASAEQKK